MITRFIQTVLSSTSSIKCALRTQVRWHEYLAQSQQFEKKVNHIPMANDHINQSTASLSVTKDKQTDV